MADISIILPVRNGGTYFKQCVECILQQTLPDFELLILDNNSTDGTTEWINTLTEPRIKLITSRYALSIEESWLRILHTPKREFITLIGHDDLLANNFLETIDGLVKQFPDASLYFTHFNYIDATGRIVRPGKLMRERMTGRELLQAVLQNEFDIMGTGFVMKGEDYDKIGGIPMYPNLLFADFELWIRLASVSYLAISPHTCFQFRLHQSMTTLSPDLKYSKSFEKLISYLKMLKQQDGGMSETINQYAGQFLLRYCTSFSHRLLRSRNDGGEYLTVKGMINKFQSFAAELGVSEKFHPEKKFSLQIARLINSNRFLSCLFRLLKKIYKKPFLK